MNIAFVDQKMMLGIGTYYDGISRHLARQGNRIWLISSAPKDAADYRKDGVQFLHVPSRRSSIRFTAQLRWDWHVTRLLKRIETEHGLDVVEFTSYLPEGIVYVYSRRRAAVCIRVHEWKNRVGLGWLWRDLGDAMRETLCWLQMARADLLLPVSAVLGDECKGYMGSARQARKIFSVRPGYDLGLFMPTADPPLAYNALGGRRVILFVGRITQAKGTYNLIEAYRSHIAPRFRDTALVLVGVPERPDQLQAALQGAGPNVIHLDDVQTEDLPAFYSHAYVFAAPSQREAFGAVFVEALACGVPVVSVAKGGPMEIVVPEETGILCPDNSPSSIAQALERLLSDRSLRERMAKNARASVVDRFGLARVESELLERYREALVRRQNRGAVFRRSAKAASLQFHRMDAAVPEHGLAHPEFSNMSFMSGIRRLRERPLDRWLIPYLLQTGRRMRRPRGPIHVLICIADHFEPKGHGVPEKVAREMARSRVETWVRRYPESFGSFRDSDGRSPRHTFFYPIEEYDYEPVEVLAGLCRAGYGEVELHLHHDNDTAENLRRTLVEARDCFRTRHGLLAHDRGRGEAVFGFIHGNWALDNSRPDGRWCGVNNELDILRETGCYADFTFPSVPSPTQPRKVNSIYYAIDDPEKPRSYDWGTDVASAKAHPRALMLIQGPLILDWGRTYWGLLPRLENGCIQATQPPHINRLALWLRARIQVPTRPDWFFVKLHCHGGHEDSHEMLLGEPMVRLHHDLADLASRDADFHYHYVTAREMYNLVKAAEDGWTGTVADALDYHLVWNGSEPEARWAATTAILPGETSVP